MADWNEFETLEAPGRDQSTRLRFSISKEFVDKHLEICRLSPIFQVSAHLYGRLPQINLIDRLRRASPTPELTTLDDAIACFEGLERPHDDEENGESVLIYVLRPAVTIERTVSMSCQAAAAVPPKSFVLTALVRLNVTLQDDKGPIDGCVTRLEWVLAGEDGLPKRHETRYSITHWTKK